MSRRVAGRLDDSDLESGQVQQLTVGEGFELVRWGVVTWRDGAKELAELNIWVQRQIVVFGVNVGSHTGCAHHRAGPSNMIDVSVGDQQRHRRQIMLGEKLHDPIRIGGCIDDDRQPPSFRGDDVGIGFGEPQRLTVDEHGPGG